jgi:hypothetical protein
MSEYSIVLIRENSQLGFEPLYYEPQQDVNCPKCGEKYILLASLNNPPSADIHALHACARTIMATDCPAHEQHEEILLC